MNRLLHAVISFKIADYSEALMLAYSHKHLRLLKLKPRGDWAAVWHLWTVMIPRRSITGRLVHGRVLRRHDGRKWIYKRFIEYR